MWSSTSAPEPRSTSPQAAITGGMSRWQKPPTSVQPSLSTPNILCISSTPQVPRESQKELFTQPAATPSAPISPQNMFSISAKKIPTGAPPTSDGSPATATSSTARYNAEQPLSSTKALRILPSPIVSGPSSTAIRSTSSTPRPPPSAPLPNGETNGQRNTKWKVSGCSAPSVSLSIPRLGCGIEN